MPGYIETLKRQAAEAHARRDAIRAALSRSLDEKILDWYTALPPHARLPRYTMEQFVRLFNAAPGRIGPALHRLGWERRRCWNAAQSYGRYWVAPCYR